MISMINKDGQVIYPEEADEDDDHLWDYLRHLNLMRIRPQNQWNRHHKNTGFSTRNMAPSSPTRSLWNQKTTSSQHYKGHPSTPTSTSASLGFVSPERITETFKHTTQLAQNMLSLPLKKHFKSRNPSLNRPRLREQYATDTFFSSVKGIGGEWCAQVFVGCKSLYGAVYGMATESQGSEALETFIADIGAPYHIHSDNAQMERSKSMAWNPQEI